MLRRRNRRRRKYLFYSNSQGRPYSGQLTGNRLFLHGLVIAIMRMHDGDSRRHELAQTVTVRRLQGRKAANKLCKQTSFLFTTRLQQQYIVAFGTAVAFSPNTHLPATVAVAAEACLASGLGAPCRPATMINVNIAVLLPFLYGNNNGTLLPSGNLTRLGADFVCTLTLALEHVNARNS